jgi:4-amino-4-deoxy-L-arabinose transferase-like glycosyltransferase
VAGEVTGALRAQRAGLVSIAVAGLLILRVWLAAATPVSFDEAYYWLWSKHLAAGYYDHPPLIAFLIRAGTVLLGDSSLGVRAGALALSFAAVWAVWRAARILLADETGALIAALFFALMPMAAIEGVVATPDAPEMAAAAFLLYAAARVQQTGHGAWWIAVGIAGGFAALSKYTAFFLGAGILVWLVLSKPERRWFRSPWPYAGAVIAILLFAPVIVWNARHGWMSFALQFGRLDETRPFTLRYLGEFIGGQLFLATPFIGVLGAAGFALILRRRSARDGALGLIAGLAAPAVLYFAIHSLHDRVQGNWPSFLYPALAVSAVAASRNFVTVGWSGTLIGYSRSLAAPVGLFVTLLVYLQALTGVIPLRDPASRLLGVGMDRVASDIESLKAQTGAKTVVTTAYPIAAWLAYFLPGHPAVIQLNERFRWVNQPPPPKSAFGGPLLYVTDTRNDQAKILERRFARVKPLAVIARYRNATLIEQYAVYELQGPRGAVLAPADKAAP